MKKQNSSVWNSDLWNIEYVMVVKYINNVHVVTFVDGLILNEFDVFLWKK